MFSSGLSAESFGSGVGALLGMGVGTGLADSVDNSSGEAEGLGVGVGVGEVAARVVRVVDVDVVNRPAVAAVQVVLLGLVAKRQAPL